MDHTNRFVCSFTVDTDSHWRHGRSRTAPQQHEGELAPGTVLAHQNLTRLPRDTELTLSANGCNKVFFPCALEDSHQLARHTSPELDEHEGSYMDVYRAAARSAGLGPRPYSSSQCVSASLHLVGTQMRCEAKGRRRCARDAKECSFIVVA